MRVQRTRRLALLGALTAFAPPVEALARHQSSA
jgi:hypothetical protein